jgi:hypothetical protein
MNKLIPLLVLLLTIGSSTHADETALRQAIGELGALNGIALACKQNALTARMREIMVDTVPKEREIGEVFEQATHVSFLDFGNSGKVCPDGKTLASDIDLAREKLRRVAGKTS